MTTVIPSFSASYLTLAVGEARTLPVDLKTYPGTPADVGEFYSIVSASAEPPACLSVTVDGRAVTATGAAKGETLLTAQIAGYRSGLDGGVDKSGAKTAPLSALAVVNDAAASPDVPPVWPDIPPVVSPDVSPVPPDGQDTPSERSSSSGCTAAGGWAFVSLITLPMAVYLYRKK